MKKVLLFLIVIAFCTSQTYGQNKISSKDNFIINKINPQQASLLNAIKLKSKKAKSSSNYYWINYGDALSADPKYAGITDASSTNTLGGFPIWPDSNAVIVHPSTPYIPFNWYLHGYADVFSPASKFISNYSTSTLGDVNGKYFYNRNNSFQVDSVRFYFEYTIQNSGTDSIFAYIISNNSTCMTKNFLIPNGIDTIWMNNFNYDYLKNEPTGTNIFKFGFQLNTGDTVLGVRTIPINLTLPALTNDTNRYGSSVAIAFRYKPGIAANLGDTLLNFGPNTLIHKKLNTFNLLIYEESAAADPTSYLYDYSFNLGNVASKEVRYNQSIAGWNGLYMPIVTFAPSVFFEHAFVDYHIAYEGAAFKFSPTTITNYSFSDISNFTPTSWMWAFGDGTTSTQQNPTHNYSAVGKYTVTLIASNSTSSYSTSQVINTCSSTSALFTMMPDTTMPHNWFAINQCIGANLSYTWNWGDMSQPSNGATPSHTYNVAGNYTICVSINDNNGCTSSYCDSFYLFRIKGGNSIINVRVISPSTSSETNLNSEISKISIYPNPATNKIYFEYKDISIKKYSILNTLGKIIISSDVIDKANFIDVKSLLEGVYYIKFETSKGEVITQKFIKS